MCTLRNFGHPSSRDLRLLHQVAKRLSSTTTYGRAHFHILPCSPVCADRWHVRRGVLRPSCARAVLHLLLVAASAAAFSKALTRGPPSEVLVLHLLLHLVLVLLVEANLPQPRRIFERNRAASGRQKKGVWAASPTSGVAPSDVSPRGSVGAWVSRVLDLGHAGVGCSPSRSESRSGIGSRSGFGSKVRGQESRVNGQGQCQGMGLRPRIGVRVG